METSYQHKKTIPTDTPGRYRRREGTVSVGRAHAVLKTAGSTLRRASGVSKCQHKRRENGGGMHEHSGVTPGQQIHFSYEDLKAMR